MFPAETTPKVIELYLLNNGKSPFENWLESLKDRRGKALIKIRLDRARLGNLGDYRAVGEGVIEMKIHHGSGYRVYFGEEGKRLIILLSGGDKSTQSKDIKNAQIYWDDYRRRGHEKDQKLSRVFD